MVLRPGDGRWGGRCYLKQVFEAGLS